MSISGNLRTMELSELLQWLANSLKTGTLERAEVRRIVRHLQIRRHP